MAVPVSIVVEIAGTPVNVRDLSYTAAINAIGTASFVVDDPLTGYIPSEDDLLEITIDGTLEWAGELSQINVTLIGEHSGTTTRCDAQDWNQLPQRVVVNTGYPIQSLKTTLEALTDPGGPLYDLGISLDAGQVTGPTLEAITAPWWTVETLLNHLSLLSGYVWRIDPAKVLKMWAIGSMSTGPQFSVVDENIVSLSWTRQRYDYRNTQWVVYGPTGVQSVTDLFVGDTVVQDFQLRYYVHTPPALGYILPGTGGDPLVPDPVTIGVYGVDSGWTYNAADQGIYQDPGDTPLSGSQSITFIYDADFPNVVSVQDAGEVIARGLWVKVATNTDIVTYAEAVAYGDALIRASLPRVQIPRVISPVYTTQPGDEVFVTLPAIGVHQACIVQSVAVQCLDAGTQTVPIATYELFGGSERQITSVELWRQILTGARTG